MEEKIIESLRDVIDPELQINIVDLGLIYNVGFEEDSGSVEITMTLTSPGCPLSIVFEQWIPAAVKRVEGVRNVKLNLVWEPAWSSDRISDEAREEMGMLK